MSEESTTQLVQHLPPAAIPASEPVVLREGGNVAVTALVPAEMQTCQTALIEWCDRKISEIQKDANELRASYEHAKEKKWKSGTLLAHAVKAEKRVVFYGKMKVALEHGYIIVPNFPVTLFAIRTSREHPLRLLATSSYQWGWPNLEQKAAPMPIGEGEYKNPLPVVQRQEVSAPTAQNPNAKSYEFTAEEWRELEFPISMSKPQIMEATSRAMALELFDQFGILPEAKKKDPIVVAQIIDPRSTQFDRKVITFMIAWHLDTRVL